MDYAHMNNIPYFMTPFEELKNIAFMFAERALLLAMPSGMSFFFNSFDGLPINPRQRIKITFEIIDNKPPVEVPFMELELEAVQ
jgi:hypothetical protein